MLSHAFAFSTLVRRLPVASLSRAIFLKTMARDLSVAIAGATRQANYQRQRAEACDCG
jgi:hypothetical protein